VILMIVLEIVLTPIFSRAHIPHLLNLQRSVVGVAMAPPGAGWPSAVRWRRRRAGRGSGKPIAGAGVDHRGRLCHRCLAGGLDSPRRMADDDTGRLSRTEPGQTCLSPAASRIRRRDGYLARNGTLRIPIGWLVSDKAQMVLCPVGSFQSRAAVQDSRCSRQTAKGNETTSRIPIPSAKCVTHAPARVGPPQELRRLPASKTGYKMPLRIWSTQTIAVTTYAATGMADVRLRSLPEQVVAPSPPRIHATTRVGTATATTIVPLRVRRAIAVRLVPCLRTRLSRNVGELD
jgi:hypothetical protein